MEIEERLTEGCDRLSRVYGNMFNALQEMMHNKEKLKELSPLDYSAIGLYIGKFVEQEINSSVVQLMRQFCGIDMPDYYCKVCREYGIDADVKNGNKIIRLNEQKDFNNPKLLKTIPLGDTYHALKRLKEEDPNGFFNDYPWLNDIVFLEAWRRLFAFRNKVAHIGELIDLETLEENFVFFQRFLKYMPQILELKKTLAPEDYIDSLPSVRKEEKLEKPFFVSTAYRDKPYAPREVALRYCELLREMHVAKDDKREMEWLDEINGIVTHYNVDAIIFDGENGKKGLKDCLGNILVPANYDGFGFIPKPLEYKRESVIAVREGRYVLAALDGSGKELTKETYDGIDLLFYHHMWSPYIYQNNGLKSLGFMDISGKEMCDCIVDKYYWGLNCVEYESGGLKGIWQFDVIFLPPIYDNIEMPGEPWEPYLFTLNGIQGYVNTEDGSFMPLDEFKKLDEDEQNDTMWNYLCEQYEIG